MRTCPIEDLRHLAPIVHLLERHLLNRSARDDHAIVIVLLDRLKILVELLHVFNGGVFRRMSLDLHEVQLDLQRGVT